MRLRNCHVRRVRTFAPQRRTFLWSLEGDAEITSDPSFHRIDFRAGCSRTINLSVEVKAACGLVSKPSKSVSIVRSSATVDGSTQIAQGESAELEAVLTGQGPWTVTWSNGVTQQNVTASPARLTVTPAGTTTYSATAVLDTHGCSGTTGGNGWVVTVTPPAPTALTATALTPNRVDLAWSYSGTADSFAIERRSSGGYIWIAGTAMTSFSDTTAAANTAYVYRVRAVKSDTQSLPRPPIWRRRCFSPTIRSLPARR